MADKTIGFLVVVEKGAIAGATARCICSAEITAPRIGISTGHKLPAAFKAITDSCRNPARLPAALVIERTMPVKMPFYRLPKIQHDNAMNLLREFARQAAEILRQNPKPDTFLGRKTENLPPTKAISSERS